MGVCPPPRGIASRAGRVNCGDIDMRIAANGQWFYHGTPILRKELVKLFASVVRRDADGAYWLVTPAEMARISVEDAPFVAVELRVEETGGRRRLSFRSNVDKWITAGAERPIRVATDAKTGEPRPYLRIAADGTEALIARPVFYELADLAEPRRLDSREVLAVESDGVLFTLGETEEPA